VKLEIIRIRFMLLKIQGCKYDYILKLIIICFVFLWDFWRIVWLKEFEFLEIIIN